MFKHFILTRFNVKMDGVSSYDKNNKPVLTEEWLERRFFLFEKYCIPSIINQTCKKFYWLVLFSNKTPEKYIQRIKNYEMQFRIFKPVFLEAGTGDAYMKEINKEIPKYFDIDDRYLITSRIDNDDAFHKDMVLEVQKLFNKQANVFISYTYGLQYDIEHKVLTRLLYENNHFISRIEEISNKFETVIPHDHTYIDKVADVVYINNKQKPLWLEIIHEGNVINSIYPESVPLFRNKVSDLYNFDVRISLVNTIVFLLKYLKLKIRLLRANILQGIGIYHLLKKNFKNQPTKLNSV
jgi:hypothetical protein